jgi:hypothetical protein
VFLFGFLLAGQILVELAPINLVQIGFFSISVDFLMELAVISVVMQCG